MLTYLILFQALALVLILLAMSMSHKNVLDADVERNLRARLDNLTPNAKRRWGKMSVAQMLRHLAGALRMATGDLQIPPRKGLLRKFPLKQLLVFVLPFPKGAPTAPALVATEECNFETERDRVRELLGSFAKRETAEWPEHPAFGPLDREGWGVLVWKHVDHHLSQFGV